MSELTPAQVSLLKTAVNIQERMLVGIIQIFEGLRMSGDPEVSSICTDAINAINHNRDILDALIDGQHQTKH